MYIFGGNDGQPKSDFFKFNFETNTWFEIRRSSNSVLWPNERYKSSACLYKHFMIIYGGNDGTDQLDDLWSFDLSKFLLNFYIKIFYIFLENSTWRLFDVKPNYSGPRESHISFVYNDSFFIYGGKSGNSLIYKGDFFEFNMSKNNKKSFIKIFLFKKSHKFFFLFFK